MSNYMSIPIPCPKCGGKMNIIRYDAALNFLKQRSWYVCRECDYQRNIDDFKKALLTI